MNSQKLVLVALSAMREHCIKILLRTTKLCNSHAQYQSKKLISVY